MSKSKKLDINKKLLAAHRAGVKQAIDTAARTNTSLIIFEDGRVKSVKPKFKYVRVPVDVPIKRGTAKARSSRKKK